MINSCKATKEINSFQFVAIPRPRDVFRKYGERLNHQGEYTSVADSIGEPCIVSAGSTIDQMINAQTMLSAETSKNI